MNESLKNAPGGRGGILVRARGVRKSYRLGKREVQVLKGIDLEVKSGEFLALRGASGAGKSTLLHLLGGLDEPDSGEIHFEDQLLTSLGAASLSTFRNRRIGFVFQAYHLFPELDALENVCLPARMARTPSLVAARRGRELLSRVGLENRMDHRPLELSGGEQQRVAIARALMNGPSLLLADEPTGNLDSRTGEEIIQLLIELQTEQGGTLIVATHDARVAARAPRQIEVRDGLVAPGP